jgi:tetratricopeptide (TPR) repeat protein
MPLVLGLAFFLCLPARAVPQTDFRGAEFMAAATGGFGDLYNLDFDAAGAAFAALAKRYPDHPAPPLYGAAVVWLRHLDDRRELVLDRFVHPGYFTKAGAQPMDSAHRQRFFDLLAAGRLLTDRRLKADSRDPDARYYRGVAEGLAAAFAITVDHSYMDAFRHGKQAYAIHSRLFQEDRRYFDASLLPGLYDYVAASLPWYLRWLTGGDRGRGLQWVSLAVDKGPWASDDARFVRLVLLAREGRLDDALADAASLSGKYPRNWLLHLTRAQLLDRMGRREEADDTYLQILRFAEEGRRNYQRIEIAAFRWEVGNRLLASRPQAALEHYQSLLSDPATDERWRVLALLQSGCALDLLGRREDAVRQYRAVLGMREYDNSHAHANEYLRSPFVAVGNSIALPRLSAK